MRLHAMPQQPLMALPGFGEVTAVVSLKGFGSGLELSEAHVKRVVSEVRRRALSAGCDGAFAGGADGGAGEGLVLYWDGDPLAQDSFTAVVMRLAFEMPAATLCAAVTQGAGRFESFERSWGGLGGGLGGGPVFEVEGGGEAAHEVGLEAACGQAAALELGPQVRHLSTHPKRAAAIWRRQRQRAKAAGKGGG